MRPRFILVRAAERIPLIKDVVRAGMIDQPVRIVDEAERHLDVQTVVPAVRQRKSGRNLSVDLFFVKMLHNAHSSGRKNVKVRPNATAKPTALTKMYSVR